MFIYEHTLCLQITKSDLRSQAKWAVTPVIVDDLFNLP